jgi:hypothetical protein
VSAVTPEWANFLSAEIGASATLTGFVVVATSINLTRILGHAHLPARAAEALFMLLASLVLLSLWLIPNQNDMCLGIEALAVALSGVLVACFIHIRTRKGLAHLTPTQQVLRIAMDYGACVIFVASGLLLLKGNDSGLTWGAAGAIYSLVAGMLNTWVLLIEIMR